MLLLSSVLLLLLTISLNYVRGGHIWTEDVELQFQNAKDSDNNHQGQISLTFMLQFGLGANDYLKISYPEALGPTNALIFSALSGANLNPALQASDQNGILSVTTVSPFYWNLGIDLAANTWYKLMLSFHTMDYALPTTVSTYFNAPWAIATVSSPNEIDAIYYDENLSGGMIARAPTPVKFKNTNFSYSAVTYDTTFEAANDIFIDIDTYQGYNDGAFIEISMTQSNFSFITACSSQAVACAAGQPGCYPLPIVSSYFCSLQKVNPSDSTAQYILFEHRSPIVRGTGIRIKATVLNPAFYTSIVGGLNIRAYSRQSKLWYEENVVTGKFSVTMIAIVDQLITYFWGLQGMPYNSPKRCPVGIYVSSSTPSTPTVGPYYSDASIGNIDQTYIVNKVRIYFTVSTQDFPTGQNHQITVKVNCAVNTDIVYSGSSFSTNLPIVTGKRLLCSSVDDTMEIQCANIGDVKKGISYWFGIMFLLKGGAYGATNFGKVSFKTDLHNTGEYDSAIQTQGSVGITPVFLSDSMKDPNKNNFNDLLFTYRLSGPDQGYSQLTGSKHVLAGNQVISIPSDNVLTLTSNSYPNTELTNILVLPAEVTVHGVQYDSVNVFKLLLLIETYPVHVCCPATASTSVTSQICVGCVGNKATNYIGNVDTEIQGPHYGAHVIFKCIFNVDVMSTYTDPTQLLKGVQIAGGFFSGPDPINSCDVPVSWAANYCAVIPYNSYTTYSIATQTTNQMYNLIQRQTPAVSNGVTLTAYGEVTLSCNSYATKTANDPVQHYCSHIGAYNINATNANFDLGSPAVVFRNVVLSTAFLANPLYPTTTVFDFIICFRAVNPTPAYNSANAPNASFVLNQAEGQIASYGILQAQVYNKPSTSSLSYFKVSLVNYYWSANKGVNIGDVMPTLLRFGGKFSVADFQLGSTALGLFLDYQGVQLGFNEMTNDVVPQMTNQVGCGSMSASTICTLFQISGLARNALTGGDQMSNNNANYLHFQNLIVFKGVYSYALEFNHFVPVIPIANTSPATANIACLSESATPGQWNTLSNIIRYSFYKDMPDGYEDSTIAFWPDYSNMQSTINLLPTLGYNNIQTTVQGFYISDPSACTQGQAQAFPPVSSLTGFVNFNADLLPGKNALSSVKLDAGLAGVACAELTSNWEVPILNSAQLLNVGWGMAFTVTAVAVDPFPSATIFTWPYSQSAYPSNQCLKYSYLYNFSVRNYVITCPVDRWLNLDGTRSTLQPSDINLTVNGLATDANNVGDNSAIQGSANTNGALLTKEKGMILGIMPFSAPWNWGENFNAAEVLSYAWSQRLGQLLVHHSPYQQNSWVGDGNQIRCSISAITGGWNRNGYAQMLTFTTTLVQVAIPLYYDVNGNADSFKIEEAFSSTGMTSNDVVQQYCTLQGVLGNTCSLQTVGSRNAFTITLNSNAFNDTSTSRKVEAGTALSINYWINAHDVDPVTGIKHGALIYGWNQQMGPQNNLGDYVIINDCYTTGVADTSMADYSGITTVLSQSVIVQAPYFNQLLGGYQQTAGSRGWFDLGFSVSRTPYKFTQFQIDLSWIGAAQSSISANLHCVPYSNQKVNFEFSALQLSNLNAIGLIPRKGQLIKEQTDYTLSSLSYYLRCFGALVPNVNPLSTQLPGVKWNIGNNLIVTGTTTDLSSTYNINSASDLLTTVTLSKKTNNYRGMEAAYTFTITTGIQYSLGARVLIEFSRAIPAKFNRGGAINCMQDGVPLYCELLTERLVNMLINHQLTVNQGSNFTIMGVSQPQALDSYKKIFVGIDTDSDFSNGINFAQEVSDIAVDTSSVVMQLLPVLSYGMTGTQTKSTFTLNANLLMPIGTVLEDKVIYVLFPGFDFQRALFHSFTPICSLVRQGDPASVIYVKSCAYVGGRRVKVTLEGDPDNVAAQLVYTLSITSIPSPYEPTSGGNVVEFSLVDANDAPMYRSNKGYFNATPVPFTDSSLTNLNWQYNQLVSYPGIYFAQNNLTASDQLRFARSFTLKLIGPNATSFLTYPAIMNGIIGNSFSNAYFGAQATTLPALYQVLFTKMENGSPDLYAVVDPVDVRVIPNKCSIGGYQTNYDLAAGGRTLPIVFSFKDCLPLSDVTLSGNVTDYVSASTAVSSIGFAAGGGSNYFTIQFSLMPVSDISTIVSSVFVQLFHSNANAAPQSNAAMMHTQLLGTNKDSYNAVNDITINVVATNTFIPVVSLLQYSSQNTLSFQCSQPGMLFFGVSLDNATISQMNVSNVYSLTVQQGYQQTQPDPQDKYFTKYGYGLAQAANTTYTLQLAQMASFRDYYLVGACSALSNMISAYQFISFTQSDNGGRTMIMFANFSVPLTRQQQAQFTCVIASTLRLKPSRIYSQYADTCSLSTLLARMLQITYSVNTSISTNNNGNIKTVTPVGQGAVHAFSITPDYFATVDTTYEDVVGQSLSSNFISLINANMNTTNFGSIGFNGVLPVRSKDVNKPSVPALSSTNLTATIIGSNVTFPFSFVDSAGFVFLVVGDQDGQTPSVEQIKAGQTGNGTKGVFAATSFVDAATAITISVQTLGTCSDYQWWFIVSDADPSPLGIASGVQTGQNFTTGGCVAKDHEVLVTGALTLLVALILIFFM